MKRTALIFLFLAVGLVSCKPDEPVKEYEPAVRIELDELAAHRASFVLTSIDAQTLRYGCSATGTPELTASVETGNVHSVSISISIGDLLADTGYRLGVQGIGPGGEEGKVAYLDFHTASAQSDLYPWERSRSSIPVPADMTLIPGPSSHRTPLAWDKERWSAHVSYTDQAGAEHWLFDSFLLIEGQQTDTYGSRGYTYVLTESSVPSAPRELWQQLLDFWFTGGTFLWQESFWGNGTTSFGRWYTGKMVTPSPSFSDGQLSALDACIRETAARIGPPPSKRYVIMGLPEPIYFQNYIASVANPSAGNTSYWGQIDGQAMDFSRVEDRIRACKWFIDATRAAFNRKHYEYIELLGFYILPEVLSTTWRAEFKKYDELWPAVAEYLHGCNEGLFWIPYNMAEGYKTWKDFGIDMAYMQPNYYWDESGKNPMSPTFSEIRRLGMGLELEFEYSMVEGVNGAASAQKYRARFEEYLRWARSSGIYGNQPLALYSGTDAMHQLAVSTAPGDREMYYELCEFIVGSQLRTSH